MTEETTKLKDLLPVFPIVPVNQIQENSNDMAIAGNTGAISYGTGWGTHSSPEVSQNSTNFAHSDQNKATNQKSLGRNSNTATSTPASASAYDSTIDQIYSKPVTPSPDEVLTGLKYELQNMIKKDKSRAKELVLNNLKQDPHFYGRLGMLGISDDEMMNINPPQPQTQGTTNEEQQMMERLKIINEMIKTKGKKAETPQSYKDALEDTRKKKNDRYFNR